MVEVGGEQVGCHKISLISKVEEWGKIGGSQTQNNKKITNKDKIVILYQFVTKTEKKTTWIIQIYKKVLSANHTNYCELKDQIFKLLKIINT